MADGDKPNSKRGKEQHHKRSRQRSGERDVEVWAQGQNLNACREIRLREKHLLLARLGDHNRRDRYIEGARVHQRVEQLVDCLERDELGHGGRNKGRQHRTNQIDIVAHELARGRREHERLGEVAHAHDHSRRRALGEQRFQHKQQRHACAEERKAHASPV
eukprot:Amastigsp_a508736_16.p3 type:complete len:161 gc:universal Amastigsp_a508736_16:980-1462(+)